LLAAADDLKSMAYNLHVCVCAALKKMIFSQKKLFSTLFLAIVDRKLQDKGRTGNDWG